MKILIDNGHGVGPHSKRSPDDRLLEYAYNREFAARVVDALQIEHYFASLLVPELEDVPLSERCRRANRFCNEIGKENVCLAPIHVNAAGNGDRWHNVSGWSCYTSPGHTEGDRLAGCLCKLAKEVLSCHKMRFDYSDGDPDIEENFYILRHTACAAVLTENGFMDNKESCNFLLSEEGKAAIVELHVRGIKEYVRLYSKD